MPTSDYPGSLAPHGAPLRSRWLWRGSLASVLSGLALAWHGRRRHGSSAALLNSPSHWIHGERALRANMPSWRFTFWGLLFHHASSMWWSVIYEALDRAWRQPAEARAQPHDRDADDLPAAGCRPADRPEPPRPARTVALVGVVTLLAWWVDTRAAPPGMRPGFERRASGAGLAWVYGAFGAGMLIAECTARHASPSRPGHTG